METTKTRGDRGEAAAVKYLRAQGYRVIERNFRCPWGEIDLVARDNDTLVFVEIKARQSRAFGEPHEAVGEWKQRRLIRTAQTYLSRHRLGENVSTRFDVVAVLLTPSGAEIQVIKNAFEMP
jgi:putative endonuclease